MFFVALAALGCQSATPAPESQQSDAAWTTIFDGTSLEGWTMAGNADWTLAEGVAQATTGNGYLVSAASYRDFVLRVEFWVDPGANSGVFIRCSNPQQIAPTTSYEVNAYDTRPDPTYRTGGIVDVAEPQAQVNADGQWNTFEITARGRRLIVVLNGVQTVDVEHDAFAEGPIALQAGGGGVKFRNVRIRTL